MSIISSDPLAFLLAQGGIVGTPLEQAGAGGVENLDTRQRGAVIGEPIPIVFCRRVGGVGGVLISPAATEARFEDDASSNITASYHLVLSEGQIDSIQVRDVFQRACRVGSFTQTYGRRAGTFVAGNFINNTPNLEAPYYCGTGGTYDGLSTLAFTVTIPSGFDQWNRQVHCFIRGGMRVQRLLGGTGPSNNVADLLLYLLRNCSKVPDAMIDTIDSFPAAAAFTNANGFWFNGVVSQSTNLLDWVGDTLPYFLLRQTRIGGKETLVTLLPTNANGSINTGPVDWAFTFTSEHVIPGSFEIIYTPLADRKPFCALALWRQQDNLGIPVMRTAEVRYAGTAIDGPFEQHDLSKFCASENHAVKATAYKVSRRKHITHRARLGVKPDAFNTTLAAGDLVRVKLERTPSTGATSLHDYLYEVDRIGKSVSGEVLLDLTHFPVDANGASVVAQEVAAATGTGLLLPTGLTGITCDVNSSADTSVPAETFTEATFPDYGSEINETSEAGPGDDLENPKDDLGGQLVNSLGPMKRAPIPGGPAGVPPDGICQGATVIRRLANIGDEGNAIVQTGGAELYSIPLTPPEELGGSDWNNKSIGFTFACPNDSVQVADPVINPRPRDGTYDVSGRGAVTISLLINGNGTRISCSGFYSNTFSPTTNTNTFTGISSITVEGIDNMLDINKKCNIPGQTTYDVPGIYIRRANGSVLMYRDPGTINIVDDEYIYTETIDVTVQFADAPGIENPIETLPRLS
jgi:hypothetical protein